LPRRCGAHPVRGQRGLAGLQAWAESIGQLGLGSIKSKILDNKRESKVEI